MIGLNGWENSGLSPFLRKIGAGVPRAEMWGGRGKGGAPSGGIGLGQGHKVERAIGLAISLLSECSSQSEDRQAK